MEDIYSGKPTDEERREIQEELVRVVGRGRIPVTKFDELISLVWSTDDRRVLAEVRRDYLGGPEVLEKGAFADYVAPQPGTIQPIDVSWELKRKGNWTVPRESSYRVKGASLHLDFREASFEAPIAKVTVEASWMSSVEIIVLPEFGLASNTQSTWWSDTDVFEPRRPQGHFPTVVIEGNITGGSSMKIRTQGPKKKFFGLFN